MLIKFNTVVAISALTITTLYSIRANAQTTLDSGNITIACAFKGSVLKDFAKRPLPGTPVLRCANGLTPSTVEVEGKVLDLYAYGTGPQPITDYGGSMRECNKLMPTGTACFTTNPFAAPQIERNICGYPSPAAYILSCNSFGCTAETFNHACASSSPDMPGEYLYTVPITSFKVAGHITDQTDFGNQSFATRWDFTENLNTAASIVRQGRIPILGLGSLLLDANGVLRPTATQDLYRAIEQYPTVFNASGLSIEVVDEPFLRVDPVSLPVRIAELKKAIALLKQLLPLADLGVTVAPVWNSDSHMVPSIKAILPGLHWLATDTYAYSLDGPVIENTLQLAREFSTYLKANYPSVERWLIIQGFAPTKSPLPTTWTPDQLYVFQQFMLRLIEISSTQYDGTLVWGWSNASELPDEYTGKKFPPALKEFYLKNLATSSPYNGG